MWGGREGLVGVGREGGIGRCGEGGRDWGREGLVGVGRKGESGEGGREWVWGGMEWVWGGRDLLLQWPQSCQSDGCTHEQTLGIVLSGLSCTQGQSVWGRGYLGQRRRRDRGGKRMGWGRREGGWDENKKVQRENDQL